MSYQFLAGHRRANVASTFTGVGYASCFDDTFEATNNVFLKADILDLVGAARGTEVN
jgi:hypothetical protein